MQAAAAALDSEADSDADDDADPNRMSKKKRKLESRLKIAALKQLCPRPEVVEVWDVTAPDPQLLVYLKVSNIVCFLTFSCASLWSGMCSVTSWPLCNF